MKHYREHADGGQERPAYVGTPTWSVEDDDARAVERAMVDQADQTTRAEWVRRTVDQELAYHEGLRARRDRGRAVGDVTVDGIRSSPFTPRARGCRFNAWTAEDRALHRFFMRGWREGKGST